MKTSSLTYYLMIDLEETIACSYTNAQDVVFNILGRFEWQDNTLGKTTQKDDIVRELQQVYLSLLLEHPEKNIYARAALSNYVTQMKTEAEAVMNFYIQTKDVTSFFDNQENLVSRTLNPNNIRQYIQKHVARLVEQEEQIITENSAQLEGDNTQESMKHLIQRFRAKQVKKQPQSEQSLEPKDNNFFT